MTPYERVFAALTAADVRFVVVGGVAVVLHGHPRMTADLEVVVDLDPEPAPRAMAASTELGLEPRLPVKAAAFTMVDPSDPLFEVDVFTKPPQVFDELWREADPRRIGDLTVRVARIATPNQARSVPDSGTNRARYARTGRIPPGPRDVRERTRRTRCGP